MWLEVTSTNAPARAFYQALGYVDFGQTSGTEVRREGGGGFGMAEVTRYLMRKELPPQSEGGG